MTLVESAVAQLRAVREQFNTSAGDLGEGLSGFRPRDGMMTAAQHMAHAAQVIDWLVEGGFTPTGFDLDFEPQIARVMAVTSLTAAKEWFERSIGNAISVFAVSSDAELMAPLPEGPVMGRMPRLLIAGAIAEHTSHHRGALAVYARLNNVVPQSPYGL
jgi:uncharacterized damage-inducible protein DinB